RANQSGMSAKSSAKNNIKMKSNLLKNVKVSLAIALTTLLLGSLQYASAATIKLEVKVSGISSWVLVKVGAWPRYGGRVIWEPSIGSYVTDDVARGENIRVTASPTPGEDLALVGIWCESKQRYVTGLNAVYLPYVMPNYVVPYDPSMDFFYVDVCTPTV